MRRSITARTLRIVISAFVFIFLVLVFIQGSNPVITRIGKGLTYFQFIPSVLDFLQAPLQAWAFGFLLILVLTFTLSRVYCSFVCPLGFLQDGIIFLSNRVPDPQRKKKALFLRPIV
jgi:polyferredoxin